jgi:hypothetical protein
LIFFKVRINAEHLIFLGNNGWTTQKKKGSS